MVHLIDWHRIRRGISIQDIKMVWEFLLLLTYRGYQNQTFNGSSLRFIEQKGSLAAPPAILSSTSDLAAKKSMSYNVTCVTDKADFHHIHVLHSVALCASQSNTLVESDLDGVWFGDHDLIVLIDTRWLSAMDRLICEPFSLKEVATTDYRDGWREYKCREDH